MLLWYFHEPGEGVVSYVSSKQVGNLYRERKATMDRQTPPAPSGQLPRQSLWQRLHTTLILWGILAPPGAKEADLAEEDQEVRRRIFFLFRRHPGGR